MSMATAVSQDQGEATLLPQEVGHSQRREDGREDGEEIKLKATSVFTPKYASLT